MNKVESRQGDLILQMIDRSVGGVAIVPTTAALIYRIQVEEMALREAFGEEYVRYSRVTKRLVPGVY